MYYIKLFVAAYNSSQILLCYGHGNMMSCMLTVIFLSETQLPIIHISDIVAHVG